MSARLWVETPTSRSGTDSCARLRERHVALAHVDAVRVARLDEVGPVVEDEQRAVGVAGATERRRGRDELVVRQLLVPELDDVDAAAERSVEQRVGVAPVRARLEDEVEPGPGETPAACGTVHGAHPSVAGRRRR